MSRKFIFIFIMLLAIWQIGFATDTTQNPAAQKVKATKLVIKEPLNKKKHSANVTHATHHHKAHHSTSQVHSAQNSGSHYSGKINQSLSGNKSHFTPVVSENIAEPGESIQNDDDAQPGFTHNMEQHLVTLVHKTIQSLHYSAYRHGGTHFDMDKGIYLVDCSDYVDNLLRKADPEAYSTLADWTGTDRPNSQHYYNFFKDLPHTSVPDWNGVQDANKLKPGDILVFQYGGAHGHSRGGHVMVVMDEPEKDSDVVWVRVADSASAGHGNDTRPPHVSGVGIGTLLLKTDPRTGKPYAFAWSQNSPWQRNVSIAMGRPSDMT